MREEEEEPSWFARWEEQLPAPDELMPLSRSLITPDLALAFDIPTSPTTPSSHPRPPQQTPAAAFLRRHLPLHQDNQSPPPSAQQPPRHLQPECDLPSELGAAGVGGGPGDEPARTLKRPRLVWTPQLHKRFVDAVAHLGIKNAVPKTIMQMMNVDGLTRENVASHLQKYRLYLKRMQGLSSSGAGATAAGPVSAAEERLFASAPVPHHFLSRGPPPAAAPRGGIGGGVVPDQFMPFVPGATLQHHQQMAAAAAAAAAHQQQQQQYYHHRHLGHMGSPQGGGFEHGYLTRQQQQQQQPGIQRMVGPGATGIVPSLLTGSYAEDLDSGAGAEVGRRKVLTLFPTGDD